MIASCWDWPSLKYSYFMIKGKPFDAGGWGPAKGIAKSTLEGMESTESIAFDDCLPALPEECLFLGSGDFCVGEMYQKKDSHQRESADIEKLKHDKSPAASKIVELLSGTSNSVIQTARNEPMRRNGFESKTVGEQVYPSTVLNRLLPVFASLGSGYVIYKGLQGMSDSNMETKHLLFAWAAGLAIGITVGQEAVRNENLSTERRHESE